jgi:hypothetical protein
MVFHLISKRGTKMNKIVMIAAAACLLSILFLGACCYLTVQGSGDIVQETRDVSDFKNISLFDISGSGDIAGSGNVVPLGPRKLY